MAQLDTARYGIPDPFPFQEARTLFKGILLLMLVAPEMLTCQKAWLHFIAFIAQGSYCIHAVS